jgi:diguanylate cyclase (GGDEF)-like protein/PAS domain S-box-containing protein
MTVGAAGPRTWRRSLVGGLALVAAYVSTAWIGNQLGEVGSLTVWYPPAGLALAGVVVVGWPAIPFIAAGELVTGVVVFEVDAAFTDLQLVVNAAGYALVWGASGLLVRRLAGGDLRRLTERFVIALGVAMAAGPLAAALWGVAMQRWAGLEDRPFWEAVGLWWTGDAVGATSVAPTALVVVYALSARRRNRGYRVLPPGNRALQAVALLSPVWVSLAIFLVGSSEVRFPYLIFIPIVLVALRYGIEGVALATFGVTPVVTVLVEHMRPEVLDKAELQALLLVGIGTGIVVGAVTSERRRLDRMHRELSAVIEASPDLVTIVDERGTIHYLNPAARAVAGVGDDESLDGWTDLDLAAGPVARELLAEARAAALRDGSWSGEVELRRADGRDVIGSQVSVVQGPDPHVSSRRRAASIVRDITEQRRLEQEIARGALYDSLTGLPNRTLLFDQVARARRRHGDIGVLLVLIDRFDLITEAAGHRVADAVVQAVAERLVGAAGSLDTVARLGGHAFAVLLDARTDELELVAAGDRLLAAGADPVAVEQRAFPLSLRVGGALASDELDEPDDLVRAAEVAAHRAAELAQPRTVLWSGRLSDRASELLAIEAELRDGLHTDRWHLAYQPIVDLGTGMIVGCEALLRWTGVDGQPISAYDLIVLAEETGLIVPLGEAVLERACLDSVGWESNGVRLPVSVNVSARQLVEPGFAAMVGGVLGRTGADPSLLSVELTETSLAGDLDSIQRPLHALHDLGVDVAMDDFGTGRSSLSQLSDLPISTVKLDKTFIDELATSDRCRQLVDGVITLAHALDAIVVAEGVEHEAQVVGLRELGCDRVQGYRFARPMPADHLLDLLRSEPRWLAEGAPQP